MLISMGSIGQNADSISLGIIDSTISSNDSATIDSLGVSGDSTSLDSTLKAIKPKRKSSLEYEVNYQADDSMRVDLKKQMVYLYGNAITTYGDIELKANYIEISLKTNELSAKGLPDSTGTIVGEPVFTQGSQMFEAGEMKYNFKTKRGLSKEVKTQEGGGYLHGSVVKRDSSEIVYIKNGMYTTCEYDEPHFHIHANKMKVIPQDKIITGPAYLSISDVPTPLAVPFGFFPNSESRSNGLIIPSYGEAVNQGFYLSRGGYYFGLNDNMDFSLTGDIYTRGTWATYLNSRYVKRYRFNGNYSIDFVNSKFSNKEYPDYFSARTFNVKWRHTQDAKARPGSSFSADVNAGSSKNFRNNLQSTSTNYLQSQLNSSIRYSKNFDNSPFSFSAAASGNQNTQTEIISIRAPEASLNMARIFPFKGKVPASSTSFKSKAGIDKIGINGSVDFSNKLEGKEDTLFNNYDNRMLKNMDNGLRTQSTTSTNIKLFKYLTVSPSTSHRIVAYRKTTEKVWNSDSNRVETKRPTGVDGFYDGSASLSASTVIYGTYLYKSDVVKAMRHQVTPTASLSYRPDYSDPFWGYFADVQSDTLGNITQYSRFEGGLYGSPTAQENGVLNLALNNTFELKVRNNKDTTGKQEDKKLRILDAFNFSTNWNIAKDSVKWNPVSIALRSNVLPGFTINASATLDPYYINPANGRRIDELQYNRTGDIGNWTRASVAFTYNIQPKKSKKKQEEKSNELSDANMYYTDFVDFDIPWSVRINYNVRYTNTVVTESVSQIVDLSGETNITQNWRVAFKTGYDLTNTQVTYSSLDVYRDLHCWEFSLGVVPFGPRQSYNFQINVKSAILQDLKLNRRRQSSIPER
jgi:lipopolysaccharide assembly outer membrane protein LptD (OstA)